MQNSKGNLGRYAWTRVKTNRHKVNKRRNVSDAHLEGRLSLLYLDLEELEDQFPYISAKIQAEIDMIQDEMVLRASPKRKKIRHTTPVEAPYLWEGFETVADLEFTKMPEFECEI